MVKNSLETSTIISFIPAIAWVNWSFWAANAWAIRSGVIIACVRYERRDAGSCRADLAGLTAFVQRSVRELVWRDPFYPAGRSQPA